jgi:hypothetical protein
MTWDAHATDDGRLRAASVVSVILWFAVLLAGTILASS